MPIKLGELLVKENLITPQQLQESLQYQKQHGGKLGYNLVKLGFVKDEEITQLLSRQYGVPSINLFDLERVNRAVVLLDGLHDRRLRSDDGLNVVAGHELDVVHGEHVGRIDHRDGQVRSGSRERDNLVLLSCFGWDELDDRGINQSSKVHRESA